MHVRARHQSSRGPHAACNVATLFEPTPSESSEGCLGSSRAVTFEIEGEFWTRTSSKPLQDGVRTFPAALASTRGANSYSSRILYSPAMGTQHETMKLALAFVRGYRNNRGLFISTYFVRKLAPLNSIEQRWAGLG